MKAAFIIIFWLTLVGCGSDDDGSNTGGAVSVDATAYEEYLDHTFVYMRAGEIRSFNVKQSIPRRAAAVYDIGISGLQGHARYPFVLVESRAFDGRLRHLAVADGKVVLLYVDVRDSTDPNLSSLDTGQRLWNWDEWHERGWIPEVPVVLVCSGDSFEQSFTISESCEYEGARGLEVECYGSLKSDGITYRSWLRVMAPNDPGAFSETCMEFTKGDGLTYVYEKRREGGEVKENGQATLLERAMLNRFGSDLHSARTADLLESAN